jgi:arabinogalactan endo-1,4-beta-galactosidase
MTSPYGKPAAEWLAETTQYPWTLANGNSPLGDSTGDFAWETSQIEPGYPATPGGQLSFVTDELSILATAPEGLGMGLFYWAPDWIPGVPWEPGAGIGSPNVNVKGEPADRPCALTSACKLITAMRGHAGSAGPSSRLKENHTACTGSSPMFSRRWGVLESKEIESPGPSS